MQISNFFRSLFSNSSLGEPYFRTGFVVGLVMVVTMTNVIQTSANSIIVCFADAPTLMELNHPTFVHNLACVSMNAFPECGGKISLNQNLPF